MGFKLDTKLTELESIYTQLLSDFTGAVTVLRDYESKPDFGHPSNSVFRQAVWRLCFSAIVLNCYKYVEASAKYNRELRECIPNLTVIRNQYLKEINENTAIIELRNGYVAHIQYGKEKRTLTNDEVQAKIVSMIGGGEDAGEFLNWICPKDFKNLDNTKKQDSLVGTIELLRDSISGRIQGSVSSHD